MDLARKGTENKLCQDIIKQESTQGTKITVE
jgi:hypothetical protein